VYVRGVVKVVAVTVAVVLMLLAVVPAFVMTSADDDAVQLCQADGYLLPEPGVEVPCRSERIRSLHEQRACASEPVPRGIDRPPDALSDLVLLAPQ